MTRRSRRVATISVAVLWPLAALTDNLTTTVTNNFGSPGGLLDMPTAEMAPEGQLSTTIAHYDGTTKTTLSFQVTKRLSASFRYSAINGLKPGPGRPAFSTFYDRSFDLSFRVLDETKRRPAVSIGFQDFIGTGLFGGEYIAATKSIGEKLRVTGGVGWGRLGSEGSFAKIGSRPTALLGEGGIPTYDRWFRGDMAAFAGASYAATDRLNFKLEYSSDAYDREVLDGITKHKSPWNFGADYKINKSARISAYSLYGSEVGVNLTFAVNVREPAMKGGSETAPLPVAVRASGARNDLGWTLDENRQSSVKEAVATGLKSEGMALHAIEMGNNHTHIMVRNTRFDMRPQAIGRAARVLSRTLPASVETLSITQMVRGIPTSTITMQRSDLENLENAPASHMLQASVVSDALAVRQPGMLRPDSYPRFDWSLGPFLRFSVFDPDNPVRANAGLQLKGDFHVGPGWVASGAISVKLLGDLDKISPPGASGLPQVRSNVALYSQTNDPTIDYLTLAKYGRPGQEIYSRATVGYLEKMYVGASAELLWKPVDSRLALGGELNYVQPRDFDQLFGTRSRQTAGGSIPEINGHMSAYYDLGNGFHGRLDAGRYLAGDWGATVALDREFANGWRIGAYATKTDVSSATFGEGSFDKGIRISIPLSWGTGHPTQRRSTTVIRSLSRDGGARLNVNGRLYEVIRDTHEPEMAKTWGKFWR